MASEPTFTTKGLAPKERAAFDKIAGTTPDRDYSYSSRNNGTLISEPVANVSLSGPKIVEIGIFSGDPISQTYRRENTLKGEMGMYKPEGGPHEIDRAIKDRHIQLVTKQIVWLQTRGVQLHQ